MTDSRDDDRGDAIFSWGKKKAKGGKKKDVQFYESFTYDGIEYFLYDSVYLFVEGEVEPYVGKLIKIYELPNKSRKVKVLWFFKPGEISHYLKGEKVLENELFLASGEGVGLTNINPLEAIAGKCNVVCISKDERNCEPSTKELEEADYVFYRTFDVGNLSISDKLGEQISAIAVRFLLNKKDSQNVNVSSTNENASKMVVGIDAPLTAIRSTPQEDEVATLIKDGVETNQKTGDSQNHNDDKQVLLSSKKTRSSSPDYDLNDLDKVIESAVNVGQSTYKTSKEFELGGIDAKEKTKNNNSKMVDLVTDSAKAATPVAVSTDKSKFEGVAKGIDSSVRTKDNNGSIYERSSKKPEVDGTAAPSSNKDKNGVRKPPVVSGANNQANDEGKLVKDRDGTSAGVANKLNKKRVSSGSADAETNVMGKKLKSEHVVTGSGSGVALENKVGGRLSKESVGMSNDISKKLDSEGMKNKSNLRLPKANPKQWRNGDIEEYGHVKEVTRRPKSGRSHWFGAEHWDDSWKAGQAQGTLVLLQNLDPSYTSSEIEDIIWHGFGESCTAKMLQKIATSSPYSGEAFVIFRSHEAAKRVCSKLDRECLMLSNGRPLVGRLWVSSCDINPSSFPGHLVVDKLRHQSQREAKAVSTSHSSQANTVEYEMAVEWRLLQDRSDLWWKKLYKEQGRELRKLKANLKTK